MDLVTMVLACSMYPDNGLINAMVQTGSQNKPYVVTVNNTSTTTYPSAAKAYNYTMNQLHAGNRVDIGLMQIPSIWLRQPYANVNELFLPCKNMVTATKVLNEAATHCADIGKNNPQCILSMYKTGNPQSGTDYANMILTYADSHPWDSVYAAAEAKNPDGFHMVQGDAPTSITTPDASSVNPTTDPRLQLSDNIGAYQSPTLSAGTPPPNKNYGHS